MNYALILSLVGTVLRVELVFMVIPLAVALFYGEGDAPAFLYSMAVVAAVCLFLSLVKPKDKKMRSRDGFMTAALSWLFISLFGALPFCFSGEFNSLADCIFEAVSGFTTTGATILALPEALPRGLMFWRCFAHWIGGMGVLVFVLAVMPSMSASSINLLKVESTGPAPGKMLPKIRETAKYLYLIYFLMTVLTIISLLLAGMPLYDSLVHSFTIAGTGGFSNQLLSVGAYDSAAVNYVCVIFLFLFGVNYTLYFHILRKDLKLLIDEELFLYIAIILAATLLVAINITPVYGPGGAFGHSLFQVVSVITTTGVSTVDYNLWPTLSKIVLILLMLTGCCAGSTGGGIKLVRILLLGKCMRAEFDKILHPRAVKPVMVNRKLVDEKVMTKVSLYFFAYFLVMISAMLIISLDGKDLITTVTAVMGTLSNAGPGFGEVGPHGSYAGFSALSKLVLSFCMLAGRLELFPVLIMLIPSAWKRTI